MVEVWLRSFLCLFLMKAQIVWSPGLRGKQLMMTLLFFDFVFGENILSLVVQGSGNIQLIL